MSIVMEPFYYVQRRHPISHLPVHNISTITRISSSNILAFVTPNNLKDTQYTAWGCHLYVCDIASPWNTYKVTSSKYCITVLEWDIAGRYLLFGDSEGTIQIWVQKDYYLSEWIQLYSITIPGERILRAIFFHNGRKIIFSVDKRETVPYKEKFQHIKYSPSVRQFGGVAADGCLVVTASGLLGAFILPLEQSLISQNIFSNSGSGGGGGVGVVGGVGGGAGGGSTTTGGTNGPFKISPITQSLGITRNYLIAAAISYGKGTSYIDESFRVAVTHGETRNKSSNMVQCYRVVIKIIDGKLTMTSQSLPSFYIYEGAGRDLPGLKITHICWTSNEDADSLIVAAKNSTGSFIELWSLVEKVTPIPTLFQTNKTEVYKTIAWTNQGNFRHSCSVIDMCVSKISFDNLYVFLTMSDSTIQVFGKDLKRISNMQSSAINTFESTEHASAAGGKQPRIGVKLVSHDVTYIGHLLIALDNQGQIYAFKLPQTYPEQCGSQLSLIAHITSLLEYSMTTGYDAIDVFVSIRPNLIEQVIDKLTENFTRQASSVQQYYYVNFLTTKTNLYRLIVSGQSKANDLTCLLMLHSILIAFKSLLRPSDLASHDKGPAENLALVLSESVPDVDKVLLNLDAKDFTVEPSTLQSLQQLIQWVADLALNILAKIPQSGLSQIGQSTTKNIGYEISKDIVALNSIRELLVMIRIWGLLNTQCLPVFLKSVENLDILATLFRLLTRLTLNPTEPDEGLLDECCLLPSQVFIPQLQSVTSIISITSPSLHLNTLPLQLTYDVEPESLKFFKDYPLIEGGLAYDGMIDSIRNIMLGKRPFAVRKCVRCGTLSSLNSVAKTAAMKAWEQRWANNCRCGGHWTYQKY